jgi:hypothetical protein
MKSYHNSVVLRNDGEDPSSLKLDLNAGISEQVTVRISSTQLLASIFDIDGVATGNPLTTDSNGNYAFKADDETYDIIVREGTLDEVKIEKVEISEAIPSDIRSFGAIPDGVFNSGTALFNACATGNTVVITKTPLPYVFELIEAQVNTVLDNLKFIRAEQEILIQLPEMDITRGTIQVGAEYMLNITVRGETVSQQSITSINIDSQAAGDHRVTFSVSDSSAYSVGGFVFVKTLTGTNRAEMLAGVWPVTSVSAGSVQCKITAFKATLPAITVSGGIISDAKTIIRVNGDVGIDALGGGECGRWRSMVLVGDGLGGTEAHGVRILGGKISLAASTAEPFGVYGFAGHGQYALENSFMQNFDSYSSGNTRNGVYFLDGSTGQSTRVISTGNGLPGLVCSILSNAAASQSILSGNGQRGILGSGGSYVVANTALIYENGDAGVRSDKDSTVDIDGAKVAGSVSFGIRSNHGRIIGAVDFTGGNGAADEFTEDNGTINAISKRYHQVGAGSGATASGLANGIVTDSDAANGITVLNKENQYGYFFLGNEVDNAEAGFRHRGTSNALDFFTQGSVQWSINSSKHWAPNTDDLLDIGTSSRGIRSGYINAFKMRSPDSTLWTVTVNDAGVLVVT